MSLNGSPIQMIHNLKCYPLKSICLIYKNTCFSKTKLTLVSLRTLLAETFSKMNSKLLLNLINSDWKSFMQRKISTLFVHTHSKKFDLTNLLDTDMYIYQIYK